MSTTAQTQVNSITTRNYPKTSVRRVHAHGGLSPVIIDKAITSDNGEQVLFSGIDVSPEEMHELGIFKEFLSNQVLQNKICNVQCMLLWNEWVRTFLRKTHQFPKIILEKEFNTVVEEYFSTGIVHEDFRGAVFTGIKFVPNP